MVYGCYKALAQLPRDQEEIKKKVNLVDLYGAWFSRENFLWKKSLTMIHGLLEFNSKIY